MTINEYISNLNTLYKTGNAREHSYRGDLQNLLSSMLPDVLVTNEPARVACGAPDYSLTKKGVPIGYIEAKDIGVDLKSKTLKEQFDRYKSGLSNLIITDYLEFQFYNDAELRTQLSIAQVEDGEIKPLTENFKTFTELVNDFATTISQSIKSPTRLAQMMAGKARLMADVIERSLNNDDELNQRSNIKSQMLSFQQMLIHDIDNKAFSDIYAQTIAYGMFAARYHDPTLEDFSRTEAAQLIPKSNPFLRKLFQDIAGYDLDDRLVWIVDELVSIFLASDVAEIMKNFGKSTKQEDPVVHFYETFLGEYSPALRKARGVWYTPEPVVNFIVRSVDEILKTEFGLSQGLADTSKTKIKVKVPTHDGRYKSGVRDYEKEVHRVQILDPATGTGTFLAEVVKQIYKKFKGQQGIWSNYVKKDLIPRLNGFELLMASYAMAHLKMDMLLTETGVELSEDQRLKIYLTNSLEEAHPDTGTLFSSWLSDEADQANAIKRDTPVMVVLGNPPYSVSSSNKSDWIKGLLMDYKRNLNERNINPLSDDYIKFIRFGQHFIDRNNTGILAYISNNSFIDGIIHRQMRNSLMRSFDKIYVLDLHGSSKKHEIVPDGGRDQNVFDIQQGVSINIMLKNDNTTDGCEIYHADVYGLRDYKYKILSENSVKTIKWNKLENNEPNYFFIPKNYEVREKYNEGFSTNDLFVHGSSGIKTERDSLTIHYNEKELFSITDELKSKETEQFRIDNKERKDGRDWKLALAKKDLERNRPELLNIHYRPFDFRYTFYTGNTKGFLAYPRNEITPNFIDKENLGLIHLRLNYESEKYVVLLTDKMTEKGSLVCGNYFISPLYIYPETGPRNPNFEQKTVTDIEESLGLEFTNEKQNTSHTFSPIDILDYIYAILHSPNYRETYKEFLKIDFPRVPLPADHVEFWKLVKLGGELRQVHLLEHPVVENYITQYPIDGDNIVTRKLTKSNIGYEAKTSAKGRVWINDQQYFDSVPLVAWEFYIGGYQPAQKWLKDRRGRELNFEDILHYQKMIVALTETDRLMKEIDEVDFLDSK
ncbi:type ISP restriction/modification enzyme [Winogradskyella sp. A2]|uniref:type ISP restriction/modification enzyme n=1 Tax=Winogradskyella sp. A2 TaxID=3366944 RepID=UPI00398C48F5